MLIRSRSIVLRNLQLFQEVCLRMPERLQMVAPRAGSVAFAQIQHAKPITQIAEEMAAQAGVLILPASVYGYPGNYFRVGFGKADFDQGLVRFEAYLQQL